MSRLETRRERLCWLAGWLEGEGSFHCSTQAATSTRKEYARLAIIGVSNDLDTLEFAEATAGGRINGPYKYGDRKKPHYQWGVRKRSEVVCLMRDLYPYMRERRKTQIEKALAKAGSFV